MERGGRNLRFEGGGRNVNKERVGGVAILLGGLIGTEELNISLKISRRGKLTKLESFTKPEEDTDDIRYKQHTAHI